MGKNTEAALVIFVWLCLLLGWWLGQRRPWDGKIGKWKLDPEVRRAKRKHGYWPEPDYPIEGWKRPAHRAYCLRCGKWPFQGPEVMYTKTEGFMCLCHYCSRTHVTNAEEVRMYAHRIIDIKICQNFDPKITHPDNRLPMMAFTEMWRGAQKSLLYWEEIRG